MKLRPTGPRQFVWWLRLCVTVAAVYWVVQQVDPSRVGESFERAPWVVFMIPLVGSGVNTVIQAHRLRILVGAMGTELGIWRVAGVICRGAFAGLALPQGGAELVKAALLARTEAGLDRSLSAVVVAKVTQLPILAVFLVGALIGGALHGDALLTTAAISYSAAAAVVLAAASRSWSLPGWVPDSFAHRADRINRAMSSLRARPRVLLRCACWALPPVLLNCTVVWMLLYSFGYDFSFETTASIVPAMDAVIWMPISVAGIGVRESVVALAFGSRGVLVDSAIAIGMIRWTGELARAGIGCMLWLLSATVCPEAGPGNIAGGTEND